MREIDISLDGEVIGTGVERGMSGGYQLYTWEGEKWVVRSSRNNFYPEKIAFGKTSQPYALANNGRIFLQQNPCKSTAPAATKTQQIRPPVPLPTPKPTPQDPQTPIIIAIEERLPYDYLVRGDKRNIADA